MGFKMSGFFRVFLVSLWISTSGAAASNTELSLQTLEGQILAGHWQSALKSADQLILAHPVQARVFAARAHLELGQLTEAIELSRVATKIDPNHRGAHLIRGVALFRRGHFSSSQLAVRRAMDLSSNAAEKQQAVAVLRDIQRVKPWRFSGSIALAPSTNITRATSSDTVTGIFGVGRLSNVVKESGVGLSYSLIASKSATVSAEQRNSLSFGTSATVYKDRSFNSSRIWTSFGTENLLSASSIASKALTLNVNRYGGSFTSADLNLVLAKVNASNPNRVTRSSVTLQRSVDFDDKTESSFLVAYNHGVTIRDTNFGFGGYYRPSEAPTVSSFGVSAYIQHSLGTALGWRANASLSASFGKWTKREPLFVDPREDATLTASATFIREAQSFYGFVPSVTISHTINRSNIELYSYEATNLSVGFVNAF